MIKFSPTPGRSKATLKCLLQTALLITAIQTVPACYAQDINLVDLPNDLGALFTNNYPNSGRSGPAARAGDFNGDGLDDLLFGSPLGADFSYVFLANGRADMAGTYNLRSVLDSASSQSLYFRGDKNVMGYDVASAGDFNGDGYDDALLPTWAGVAYLVFGGPGPHPSRDLTTINSSTTWALKFTASRPLKKAVGVGDINNDGCDDIVIPAGDNNQDSLDYAWVIFGSPSRKGIWNLDSFQTSDANGYAFPETYIINVSPAGDFNSDGFADYLMFRGSDYSTPIIVLGKSGGFTNLSFKTGPPPGTIKISPTLNTEPAFHPSSSVGISADFNGDGRSDIALSGYKSAGATHAYVVYGRDENTTNILLSDVESSSSLGFRIDGVTDQLTSHYTWVGDVNKDGFADLSFDSQISHNGINRAGSSLIIYGNNTTSGVLNLARDFQSGVTGFRVEGSKADYGILYLSAPAGDVNGDQIDDVLFACTGYDSTSRNMVGFNYVVFGRQAEARVADFELWD